ncbi:MAG: biotin--[acetyl-CoA-carboxylase] ligase [Thermoplasmata archaeon]|jgi:BirA family biotin operon repressor/biotin-[acetyl-CoA-carboxylase] ligase
MGSREVYATLPSTQDRAIELARAGAPDGTCVVARHQSAGRGRRDHTWESPIGGLYLSLIVRAPEAHRSLVSLAIGAGLHEAIAHHFGVATALKWPNDLLIRTPAGPPRKLSGIVIDEVASPSLGTVDVAGIGVNVRLDREQMSAPLRAPTASLGDFIDPPPPLEEVEEVAASAAIRSVRQLDTAAGARSALSRCRAVLYGVGRRAWIDGVPSGIIQGIGDEGELVVAHGSARFAIRAGDLRVEES